MNTEELYNKTTEELYDKIVETLASGNFLTLNGKPINLSELSDYINAQQQEIEKLTELCNKYEEEHKTTFEIWQKDIKENEHLRTALNSKESIIKEVREYIEENQEEHKYTDRGGFTYTEGHFLRDSDTLLEILDKAEEK